MKLLKLTSCQAEIAESLCEGVAGLLAQRLGVQVEFVAGIPWKQRERLLDAGEVHAGWICGLPWVWRADRPACNLELLAAPVMSAARYGGLPVYFSDVVVASGSRFRSFADLRGAVWAYNEPASHSGYNVVRSRLSALGEGPGYFSRSIESGSHQNTIALILSGQADGSAIDSTVLELAIARDPSLRSRLRVVETFGPSPVPPWVVHTSVPAALRARLREALLGLHQSAEGSAVLARTGVARFARVTNRDYDPIREMDLLASRVSL